MHRLYWHSKDFQRYFFTYIALFVCVFLVGISIFSAAMRKERKEANEKSFFSREPEGAGRPGRYLGSGQRSEQRAAKFHLGAEVHFGEQDF